MEQSRNVSEELLTRAGIERGGIRLIPIRARGEGVEHAVVGAGVDHTITLLVVARELRIAGLVREICGRRPDEQGVRVKDVAQHGISKLRVVGVVVLVEAVPPWVYLTRAAWSLLLLFTPESG